MTPIKPDIAAWLSAARPALSARWVELIGPGAAEADGAVLTASPQLIDVEQLYSGLELLATGASTGAALVAEAFGRIDPEQSHRLGDALGLARRLRRAAWAELQAWPGPAGDPLSMAEAIDELFEQVSAAIVAEWARQSEELIREREFIAQSLDAASAAADQRALQLQALNVTSQQLSAILEVEELIDLVVNNLHSLTGVAHVSLWQAEGQAGGQSLVMRQACGQQPAGLAAARLSLHEACDMVARAYSSGVTQFSAAPDPSDRGPWHLAGCGVMAMPMLIKEQPIAVILLQDQNPIEQLRVQTDLAQGVISQAAIAMANARLYAQVRNLNVELEQRVQERTRELQEEKDRLATIHQISTEVSSTLDLGSLLNTSLELLAHITQAEHASIMLVEQDDSSLLVTRAVLGVGVTSGANNYARFPIGSGIAGWVAQHRKAQLIDDVSKDERWVAVPGGSLRRQEGSMISVPLIVQGEVLGVMTLSHSRTGFFQEGYLRMLSACAGAIAIGINNANLFQMISAEAERRYELLDHQQKEASQIAAILQSLSDGVIVCDLYGSVLVANPSAAGILQRDVEELLLWNLHDILSRYLGPRLSEMPLNELISRPIGHHGQPRMFQSTIRQGSRVVSLTMGPVLKDDGELLGALLVLRDITREVEADRLKTEFIGTMSHELRTPMTAIKGFTQLLAMGGLGPLNDTQREFVSTIHSNTERMIALINDVLDITKIESGSVDLEWRSLHLAEALSGVVAELQGLINDRRHELTIGIPPGLPLVRADAHRLHQILYNLLANAVKYTPRGGTIAIEAHEANLEALPASVRDGLIAGRRYTQMTIRDNGVGISEEDLPRVFERFYRTENPLKIEAGGTGLGLSLVRPLVELLGGKIWAVSAIGEGSSFSFILPAAA